jgi:hypothetical protein
MAKPTKAELLAAVSDVLTEAIDTYEKLEKANLDLDPLHPMPAEQPKPLPGDHVKSPLDKGMDLDPLHPSPAEQPKALPGDHVKSPLDKEAEAAKEKEEKEKKDKEKDKKDEECSDDELKEMHKSIMAKMEKRGLIKAETITKSEAAPAPAAPPAPAAADTSKAAIEELRKSFEDKIGGYDKKIDELKGIIEKFAAAPAAPRRGLSGASPLMKSGDAEAAREAAKPKFSKLEALDRLVELRKSGDRRVDTDLITRTELGKLMPSDYERLEDILA